MSTEQNELSFWLRLVQTPGVGSVTARKLLSEFGLPENIFSAGLSALKRIVPEKTASALIQSPSKELLSNIEKTIEWNENKNNNILTLADENYPKTLLEIADPPLILYVKGKTELLSTPSLAIVGSRHATAQGVANAENFARALSRAGLSIVSGMALGIDAAAHRGGLQGQGSTIAVIGTGADIVYPAKNRDLAHKIAENGCIVSEYPINTPAVASNFPRRNRIISGLSKGVLVVEAAAQSGSLITARSAAEQNKEVFAIPGSIHSTLSKGCHALIKQGAKLVESAQDILEELNLPATIPASAKTSKEEEKESDNSSPLLKIIGFDPVDTDTLCQRSELSAADLSAQLLTLELDGLVERMNDGKYRRLRR